MDEVKFKRVMSISASRILNIARFTEDGDITQDEFFKIMFILASLEEAQWNKDKLKIKAKSYLESLSGTASEEIEKAILECQDMYINYWDLIDKQNKKRNFKKNAGAGKTIVPVQEKKERKESSDMDFWIDGDNVMMLPRAKDIVENLGYDLHEVCSYIQENESTLVLPFAPYSIEEILDMYDEQMKRQYPAAPSRGK